MPERKPIASYTIDDVTLHIMDIKTKKTIEKLEKRRQDVLREVIEVLKEVLDSSTMHLYMCHYEDTIEALRWLLNHTMPRYIEYIPYEIEELDICDFVEVIHFYLEPKGGWAIVLLPMALDYEAPCIYATP